MHPNCEELRLTVLHGPDSVGERWQLQEAAMCGRTDTADIRLDNQRVSRRHAVFSPSPAGWTLRDHSSHGTLLNSVPIGSDQPVPIRSGDRIAIGPFVLGVGDRPAAQTVVLSAEKSIGRSTISIAGRDAHSRTVSADRLRMVFESAAALRRSESPEELAAAALSRLLDMTGFQWGAILEFAEEDAVQRPIITDLFRPDGASVSASLLREAQTATASLHGAPDLRTSESIIGSRTHDAIASTVRVGDQPVWQVYLASVNGSRQPEPEAAMIVDAMTQLTGLLLSDRQREDLAVRQSQFQRDIDFAREVQKRLLGKADGLAGMLSIPGRGVAGDLVGCRVSPSGSRFFFLGDVSGKGPGAAMLMAATQAYVTSLIDQDLEIEDLVPRLNAYLHQVSAASEFVTLWIGEFDPARRLLRYTDAGHGYAFLVCGDRVTDLTEAGGPPVGVLPDSPYAVAELETTPGCCMLLCSDGVVEQHNADGRQFGRELLRELLAENQLAGIERSIVEKLTAHAGSSRYSDDVTIATVAF